MRFQRSTHIIVQALVRHSFLGELRIRLIRIRHESDTSSRQDTRALNLTPLRKVSCDHLFDVIGDVDSTNIQRAILAGEGSHTSHIIAIIRVLISPEAVNVRVEEVVYRR